MKTKLIWFLVIVLTVSMIMLGTSCKAEEAVEETTEEEAVEETTEEEATEEEAEDTTEDEVSDGIARNADGEVISVAHITFPQFTCYKNRCDAGEIAAEDYGIEYTVIQPEPTLEGYVEAMFNAGSQDFDGIIVEVWDVDSFTEPLDHIKANGIPMVEVHIPWPEDGGDYFISEITIDNVAYAYNAANVINDEKDGKANILFMMTRSDVANQVTMRENFEIAINELSPDLKIVSTEFTEADTIIAAERLESAFKAYPEIDVVIFVESGGVTAAATVAKEMGILEDIMIVGVDDPPDLVESIENGEVWGTLIQNFQKQGYESVRNLVDYYLGNPFPENTDAGLVLVTGDTIENYMDVLWGPIAVKGKPYSNLE